MKIRDTRILASAHDLGGANQLLFALKDYPNVDFVLTGPALGVGQQIGINIIDPESLELSSYTHFFVASNFNRELSDSLLVLAHQSNIKTVGFLDHWVDLGSRWEITPDKVITSDFLAYLNALRYFKFRVRLVQNRYLGSIKEKINHSSPRDLNSEDQIGLVILQQINESFKHNKDLSNCFCQGIRAFVHSNTIKKLVVREHVNTPSDDCIKYLTKWKPEILISKSAWDREIFLDLQSVTHVLGMDSYALYVAKKLGKKTYSFTKPRNWLSPRYTRISV